MRETIKSNSSSPLTGEEKGGGGFKKPPKAEKAREKLKSALWKDIDYQIAHPVDAGASGPSHREGIEILFKSSCLLYAGPEGASVR